jgi:phage terminase large subunit-like protein
VACPLVLPERVLPIDPYVLGAWLGDGTSRSAQITCADEEIIKRIRSAGLPVRPLPSSDNGKALTYSLSDGNKQGRNGLISKLKALDLLQNKHIPVEYFIASKQQRYDLLRGILDTDGTISKAGQISLTLKSKRLIKDVLILVRTLGIKANLKQKIAKIGDKNCGIVYLIHFFPQNGEPLFYVRRKATRQKPIPTGKNRRALKTICNSKYVGHRIVNCITVEGGLYLAGKGFTITHNSVDAATAGLYMLAADHEKGAEVYSGATSEKQALEVFRPAWMMANRNEGLREAFNLSLSGNPKNPTSIYRLEDMSRFEPLIGKPGDGASPHCAIIDEYHEHKTSEQYDTMDTGMGAREQPMLFVITTAGTDTSSPCYDMHLRAIKVLEKTVENEALFAIMYGIGPDDDWKDFECWKKANPNYGVSVMEDYLYRKYTETMTDASKQNINLCKHLNQWMNAGVAWMNMAKWEACKDPSLSLEDFKGQPCYAAFDLASKIDISSLVLVFEYNGGYAAFAKHYLPEETVKQAGNDHYVKWEKEGYITQTPGARTDFKYIEDDLKAINDDHPIVELAYDPRESTYLVNNVMEWLGPEKCIEITQGPALMSEPMKEVEALIYDCKLWHSGDPVLTWMMGNIVKRQGRNTGPVKYYYPTKERNENKIDGGVCLIMATGRALAHHEESAYEGMTKDEILKSMAF